MKLPALIVLCAVLLIGQSAFSQTARPVNELKDWIQKNEPEGYNARIKYLTLVPKGSLNYLYPFWLALKEPDKFRKIYSDNGFNDELAQVFAFAGDYRSALEYLERNYDTLDDQARRRVFKTVEGLKDIKHVDARRYLSFMAHVHRVIMVNEAYAKPLHRAFTLSLLGDLYRQGFRYLAMEMLNNNANQSLSGLDVRTGHYCAEPVAGELVRGALAMGYTLISYEDTAARMHTATQRDSIQAAHIYAILQRDSSAKILVHAGYAHISKKPGDDGYIPMGLAFQRLSGIEPLTVDQTDMTEGSNFSYGKVFYEAYLQRFPLNVPSIALYNNEPVNVTNNDLYDLTVIHPLTVYKDERPSWLTLGGLRKPLYVRPPAKNTFLVQAYYQSELVANDNKTGPLIPADQSYYPTAKNNYLLYLQKGKYIVVFRDMEYKVLNTLNIEIN